MNDSSIETRVVELESLLMRQEQMIDALNEEVLRLNRLFERLSLRFEEHEVRQAAAAEIRSLAEEVPPPHY